MGRLFPPQVESSYAPVTKLKTFLITNPHPATSQVEQGVTRSMQVTIPKTPNVVHQVHASPQKQRETPRERHLSLGDSPPMCPLSVVRARKFPHAIRLVVQRDGFTIETTPQPHVQSHIFSSLSSKWRTSFKVRGFTAQTVESC